MTAPRHHQGTDLVTATYKAGDPGQQSAEQGQDQQAQTENVCQFPS